MTTQPTPPVLYTVADVAKALGSSTKSVRYLIRTGRLDAINVSLGERSPRFRITAQAFEEYLASRRVVK